MLMSSLLIEMGHQQTCGCDLINKTNGNGRCALQVNNNIPLIFQSGSLVERNYFVEGSKLIKWLWQTLHGGLLVFGTWPWLYMLCCVFEQLYTSLCLFKVFIRHRRLENPPSTTQNSPAKFRLFPERAKLFHNNSPVTLRCSPVTTILNENPAY